MVPFQSSCDEFVTLAKLLFLTRRLSQESGEGYEKRCPLQNIVDQAKHLSCTSWKPAGCFRNKQLLKADKQTPSPQKVFYKSHERKVLESCSESSAISPELSRSSPALSTHNNHSTTAGKTVLDQQTNSLSSFSRDKLLLPLLCCWTTSRFWKEDPLVIKGHIYITITLGPCVHSESKDC